MLKAAAQSAALFVFLLVSLFLGFLLVRTLFPPVQSIEQGKTERPQQYNAEKDENRKSAESFWQRPTDDPVAFFTLWIAAFTALLVLVSAFQIGFLIRADDIAAKTAQAAKDSAEAARQSADAVGNVERPYIFVFAKPVSLAPKDGPDDQYPQISYAVTNMGRVPAVVRLIYSVCKLIEKLDSQQTVEFAKFRPSLTAIPAGLTNSNFPVCTFEKPITAEDWADIRADRKMAVFEAIFAYEGALDFTYITSLAYKIDLFSGHAFTIGASAYNYDQRQQGRLSETEKLIFPKVRASPAPTTPPPANSTLPNQ